MSIEQFNKLLQAISENSIFEIISSISTVIIAIASLIALIQLKISKSDIKIRSKREALTLTASLVEKYNEVIIPLQTKIDNSFQKNKVQHYNGKYVKTKNEVDEKLRNWIITVIENDQQGELVINLLNHLESFSLYFMNRIADEQVAFLSLGQTYIYTVKKYSPFIAIMIDDDNVSKYSSTSELYKLWHTRIEKQKVKKQVDQLNKIINSLNDRNINPIGI